MSGRTCLAASAWLPPNGALHGALIDRLLGWNLAVIGALLLLAHILLVYALLRARQGTRSTAPSVPAAERARGSAPTRHPREDLFPPLLPRPSLAEALPILGCCLLFATMAIASERLWASLRYDGPSPSAMQVEVVGVQFQWYFRYPGPDAHFGGTKPQLVNAAAGNPLGLDPSDSHSADDVVSSALILPAGREVDLRLRAHDVIHGFFIPGMRLKQNAVPGLVLHVHFTPAIPGVYPILCTQVCGSGHARMQAVLRVVSSQQFATWLATREKALPQAAAMKETGQ